MSDDIATKRMGIAGDETVGITDVDCTPRPRFRESLEAFSKRMKTIGLTLDAKQNRVRLDNRANALTTGTWPDGAVFHVAQCACRWHSLRQTDPELALRELDAHACSIDGDSIHRPNYQLGEKRPASTMAPPIREDRPVEVVEVAKPATTMDETEQRMALLEFK